MPENTAQDGGFRIEEITPRELEDASLGRALISSVLFAGTAYAVPDVRPPDDACLCGLCCCERCN